MEDIEGPVSAGYDVRGQGEPLGRNQTTGSMLK